MYYHDLTSWPNWLACQTLGPGSIPGWALLHFFFFFFFRLVMQNYFKQVIWNYIKHSLMFYIELSSKIVGDGVKFGPPET